MGKWPFELPKGEIRMLDAPTKLEIVPISQPLALAEQQSKCRLSTPRPGRVPVRIMAIDGVPQPRGKYLMLKPETVKQLEEYAKEQKTAPADLPPEQEDLPSAVKENKENEE